MGGLTAVRAGRYLPARRFIKGVEPPLQQFQAVFCVRDKFSEPELDLGVLHETRDRAQPNYPTSQPDFFVFQIHRPPRRPPLGIGLPASRDGAVDRDTCRISAT